MSVMIRVGLGCGLATSLAAMAASIAFAATTPGDHAAGRESVASTDNRLAEQNTMVRVVAPADGLRMGIIIYGIPRDGRELRNPWGGPR